MLSQDQCYCLSLRSICFQFSVILMAPHVRSSVAMPSWKWFHKITGDAFSSQGAPIYTTDAWTTMYHHMPTMSELFSYCLLCLQFKRKPKKRSKHCTGPKPQETPFTQVKVNIQFSRSNKNSRTKLLFQSCRQKVNANLQLMRTEEA